MARTIPENVEQLDELSREASEAKAEEWREKAIAELRKAGNRLDWNVGPVIEGITEVHWSPRDRAFIFEMRHGASGFMEFGTSPHIITPDEADALHWTDENTGEDIFAMIVNHPGQPATMFTQKSRERILGTGVTGDEL